jgi:phage shock protein E
MTDVILERRQTMLFRWLSVLTLPAVVLAFVLTGIGSASQVRQLSVQEVKKALDNAPSLREKGFVLVDVRTVEEHDRGAIPGTDLNIEFREMGQRHREIGAGLEDHIVVYCQTGKRSNIAADTLNDLGYKNVYNIRGSMNAWLHAGYPVIGSRR